MDICLARTYLAVVATGSFIAAAEKLNITQTAVSARVRALEEQLECPLFVRNKSGARLTVAGERFLRHATILVQAWENARRQVSLPLGRDHAVSVGAELSLWDPPMIDWLTWMRAHRPDVAVRAEVDSASHLLERVRDGSLDIAVLHNPPQQPELVVELVCEEKLVLVTTDKDGVLNPDDYIFVDWGQAFAANMRAAGSTPNNPAISINFGPLARSYLLAAGGAGYFRLGSLRAHLADGRLHLVPGAPEFSHSINLVYAARHDHDLIDFVRESLRECFTHKT